MKIVVIYKSKTGYSKQYAERISEKLACDVFDVLNIDDSILKNYDTVIYGGGLYAGGINGINYIKKNLNNLNGKKVIVFATGLSPFKEEIVTSVKNKNFTLEEQKHIKFFYLRGGFDYKKLNQFDKMLMTLLKWKIKKKKDLTSDEKGMLDSYDNPVDFTRKESIDEIIKCVNS